MNANPTKGAVRMACGNCCLPACHVQERVRLAMAEDSEVSTSGQFVVVECTSSTCTMGGQLHMECYKKLKDKCISALKTNIVENDGMAASPVPPHQGRPAS